MKKAIYANAFDILENPKKSADLQFRSDLMIILVGFFEKKEWSQKEIAKALKISQPRVSELKSGKINLFSSDKLLGFLAVLGISFSPIINDDGLISVSVTQP